MSSLAWSNAPGYGCFCNSSAEGATHCATPAVEEPRRHRHESRLQRWRMLIIFPGHCPRRKLLVSPGRQRLPLQGPAPNLELHSFERAASNVGLGSEVADIPS